MALIRVFVIGFVFLSVIYVSLSLYSRAVRKGKLRREWEEAGAQGDPDAYIREGLVEYDNSLRKRLILGVYIIPMILVGTIIYVVNYA